MKTYRELYFKGDKSQIEKFINEVGGYVKGDWSLVPKRSGWENYLFFDYIGKEVDKARVSIYTGSYEEEGELSVGNIIPLEKNELTTDEYNNVLVKFYNDVIEPYKESGTELKISELTNDVFNPLTVISEKALRKLKSFCDSANKSTGSTHPCDRERWFDFICQTVDDDMTFDASTLASFLQDEDYWGTKPKDFIGVIGEFAWDEDKANELALEYESLCEGIKYYKKTRGI